MQIYISLCSPSPSTSPLLILYDDDDDDASEREKESKGLYEVHLFHLENNLYIP